MVSQHENEEQCQIIPDYSHDFVSGLAVEFQLSWLFLWLFLFISLNIPNYAQLFLLWHNYAHNRSRSNGHSLGNQLPQERAIAWRGPEARCPLRFRIGHQTPDRRWKESVVLCCLCLSALQVGIIRITWIKIIVIIGIIEIIGMIGMIEIISKSCLSTRRWGPNLQMALCVKDELLRDGWTPLFFPLPVSTRKQCQFWGPKIFQQHKSVIQDKLEKNPCHNCTGIASANVDRTTA